MRKDRTLISYRASLFTKKPKKSLQKSVKKQAKDSRIFGPLSSVEHEPYPQPKHLQPPNKPVKTTMAKPVGRRRYQQRKH